MSSSKVRPFIIQELINSLCYFAPLSFIAIFLYEYRQLSQTDSGIIMMFGVLVSRCTRFFLAPLVDKIRVNLLVSGLQVLGGIGFLLLPYKGCSAFVSIFLISICYGNNSMLLRVLVNEVHSGPSLNRRFAMLHVATNWAAMIGPLLFTILTVYFNMSLAIKANAIVLFFSAAYSFVSLGSYRISSQESHFSNLRTLIGHGECLQIYFLVTIAYFFYAQIFSLAPILLSASYNNGSYIWIIGFINSLVAVLFSMVLTDLFQRKVSVYTQICIGFILSILGFTLLLFVKNSFGVYSGVLAISFAEIAFIPGFQVALMQNSPKNHSVTIFAVNALCMGIGESFGQYYGVVTGFGRTNSASIFLIYFILALGGYMSMKLAFSSHRFRMRTDLESKVFE